MGRFDFRTRTGQISAIIQTQAGTSIDADAQAYFDRVTAAGGTLSVNEINAVNTLVISLKSNGIWTLMKAIYPMVGASAAACAQNLKSSSFTGTFTSGWTFASTGVTPNGSAFMDTNFATTIFNVNNNAFGFYTRTNVIGTQGDMGVLNDGSTNQINMGANYLSYGAFARNFTTASGPGININSLGFYINSRIVSTQFKMYKNDSTLMTVVANSATALSGIRMALGGHMNVGNASVSVPSTKEYSFAFLSDGLSDTNCTNFYSAVQTFQTSLIRQV